MLKKIVFLIYILKVELSGAIYVSNFELSGVNLLPCIPSVVSLPILKYFLAVRGSYHHCYANCQPYTEYESTLVQILPLVPHLLSDFSFEIL